MLASDWSGLPGMAGGSAGFSTNSVMWLSASSIAITPKALASSRGTSMQPTVHGPPLGHMVGQHERVVHLVDVVAGQHDDVVGACSCHDVVVLVHGIGRAAVPALVVVALLRRQQVDELVHLVLQEAQPRCRWRSRLCDLYCVITPMRRMPEFMQFDSAKSMMRNLPPKVHRRLGAPVGQVHQAAATPPGQHQRHRTFGQVQSFAPDLSKSSCLRCGAAQKALHHHLNPATALPVTCALRIVPKWRRSLHCRYAADSETQKDAP
jgi:hypothetical protein